MTEQEHTARQIADALEIALPDLGFAPYRYPSGENKSVHASFLAGHSDIDLIRADGAAFRVTVVQTRDADGVYNQAIR